MAVDIVFFGPARLDTGLFVPRRLVCLLLSFLRSIPCFHEHVFLFCIVISVLHASREGFCAWKMGVPLSFSSPFRLHLLFFFFRRVLKALPLLPYAGWHTAARLREWDRVLSHSFEFSQDRGLYDILLCLACFSPCSTILSSSSENFLLDRYIYQVHHPTPAKSRSSALLANQCLPSRFSRTSGYRPSIFTYTIGVV